MRIAELIFDAYEKTGLIPQQKTWMSFDGTRACGMTALGIYSKAVLRESVLTAAKNFIGMNPPVQNWAGLKFGYPWMRGFISGFDSLTRRQAESIYGVNGVLSAEFLDGYNEGLRTWQMVEKLISVSKTPVQENNSKPEQSETTEQEEVVSISSHPTLCLV